MVDEKLELRIEPSFDFAIDYNSADNDGTLSFKKKRLGKGLDVSLYRNQKICLSPMEEYTHLNGLENQINRTLEKEKVIAIYPAIISAIMNNLPRGDIVYHIRGAHIGIDGFNKEDYENKELVLDGNCNSSNGYRELFLHSRKIDPELFNRFWAREHPSNNRCDYPQGNDMKIYIPLNFKSFWDILNKFDLRQLIQKDDSVLKTRSQMVISNLSHGYRLRLEKRNDSFEDLFELAAQIKKDYYFSG